jgi:serine/threonine protein kinase
MPGHLARGHRAAGRYRLEAELGQGEMATAWRGVDEALERPVSLRFFDPSIDRSLLMERAAIAASLTHPRVVRLFDTGFDGGQFFTVSELMPGSLAWSRPPLQPAEVVRLGTHVAEALLYAHRRGVAHGALGPGNVLLSEQGAKVADFALSSAALDGSATPDADLRQLGALLRGALLVRSGAQAQPVTAAAAGIARVADGLIEGRYDDARAVLEDLSSLAPPQPGAAAKRPRAPWMIAGAGLGLLALLGVALLGSRGSPGSKPTAPPRINGVPHRIAAVQDFDPLGDGSEDHSAIKKLADGDPRTFWTTERYRSSRNFSGRKTGVGVIVDLGVERAVGNASILLVSPGCGLELRYATARSDDPGEWKIAALVRDAGSAAALRFPSVRTRWWLVWITRLTSGVPGAGGAFACAVSEVALYPP